MGERIDDQELAIAAVYADSLLELAGSRGQAEEVLDELDELAALLEEYADLAAYLCNPTVATERRRQTIERAFRGRADDLVVNTLQVMNRRDRLDLVRTLAAAYRDGLDESRDQESVDVVTAVPLSEQLKTRLQEALERISGHAVRLFETVDPSLIGGLVVRIGDEKIDTSVARSLALLTEKFAERASLEVQRAGDYVMDSEAAE